MNKDKKIPICRELYGTEYEQILNMTDEEAADIIINTMINYMGVARGNGKSIYQLRIEWALRKAIKALGSGTPNQAMLRNPAISYGLKSNTVITDETSGIFDKPVFLTKHFNTPVNGKLYNIAFETDRLRDKVYEQSGPSPKLLNKEVSVNDKTH